MIADVDTLVTSLPARVIHTHAGAFSYREVGAGAPVVLLHGIGSSSASWIPTMTLLRDGCRSIAWDAPGYGDSSALPIASPSARDYASALAAMLDALAVQRMVLVGHSLGALVAGSFAAAHPERVQALLLADPASGYGLADPGVRVERLSSRLKLMEELGPEGMADRRAQHLLGPNASPQALALVRWSMRRLHPGGHEQAARMLAEGRLIEDVTRFHGPALVVCGSEDSVTPEEGCRRVAQAIERAEYRSLPGLGHASYVEAPHTAAALIRELASAHP